VAADSLRRNAPRKAARVLQMRPPRLRHRVHVHLAAPERPRQRDRAAEAAVKSLVRARPFGDIHEDAVRDGVRARVAGDDRRVREESRQSEV
jgi:hypothetical protein